VEKTTVYSSWSRKKSWVDVDTILRRLVLSGVKRLGGPEEFMVRDRKELTLLIENVGRMGGEEFKGVRIQKRVDAEDSLL